MNKIILLLLVSLICLTSVASAVPNQTENASHNISVNLSEREGNVTPHATPTIKLINPNLTVATEPAVLSTYVPTPIPTPVPTIAPTPVPTVKPKPVPTQDFMTKYKSQFSIFGAVVLITFLLYIVSVALRAWKE